MRLFFFFLLLPFFSYTQTKAVTLNGDTVVLYTDMTWKYFKAGMELEDNSPVNSSTPSKRSTPIQCSATTKSGSRCKLNTYNSSGKCHVHSKK
jgi:hypothetical protein